MSLAFIVNAALPYIRTKTTHELYEVQMLVISIYACAFARSLKSELKHEPCHSIKLLLFNARYSSHIFFRSFNNYLVLNTQKRLNEQSHPMNDKHKTQNWNRIWDSLLDCFGSFIVFRCFMVLWVFRSHFSHVQINNQWL